MNAFLEDFFDLISSFYGVFNSVSFVIAGITVGLLDIMIGFLCISMIVTVLWKGAKG